jgi:hypothetical protein
VWDDQHQGQEEAYETRIQNTWMVAAKCRSKERVGDKMTMQRNWGIF